MPIRKLHLTLIPILLTGLFAVSNHAVAEGKNTSTIQTAQATSKNNSKEVTKKTAAEKAIIKTIMHDVLMALAIADAPTVLKHAYYPNMTAEEIEEYKRTAPAYLKEAKETIFDPKGGIKTIETVEVQLSDDYLDAVGAFKVTFADNSIDAGELGFSKVNGVWKMQVDF